MYCSKCGSSVNSSETFCRTCGAKLNESNNSISKQEQINDDALVKAYIGKNADKILNGGFSICSFLFGVIYAFYRKMWFLAVLWIVSLIISFFFLSEYYLFIAGISNIVIAIMFNKMYLKNVYENINRLRVINPGKTDDELKEICARNGGVSVVALVICTVIYGIIFFLLMIVFLIILGKTALDSDFFDELNNYFNTEETETTTIVGYQWAGSDDSDLYLNADMTFVWYKDDDNTDDNYYTGTYKILRGSAAVTYIADDLNSYGVTREEQNTTIKNHNKDFNGFALNYYYMLELNTTYAIINGEVYNDKPTRTPFMGFYYENEKYLDVANMNTANYSGFTRKNKLSSSTKTTKAITAVNSSFEKLAYKVPGIFSGSEYRSTYFVNYSAAINNQSCIFDISYKQASEYDYKAENILPKSEHSTDEKIVNEVQERVLNDVPWKYVVSTAKDELHYFYAALNSDYIYEINYRIFNNSSKCAIGLEELLNSLKFN